MKTMHSTTIGAATALALAVAMLAPTQGAVASSPTEPAPASELTPLRLWYDEPATASTERLAWERQALPLGNGHMGAMVFGRTDTERVQLNEDSLWTGGPGADITTDNVDDYGNVELANPAATMANLVDTGFARYYESLASGGAITGTTPTVFQANSRETQGAYQNFAEMYLDFGHTETTDYARSLDLRTAVAAVDYTANEVRYHRESFMSYPDRTLVYRIEGDRAGAVDFDLRPEIANMTANPSGPHGSKNYGKTGTVVAEGDTITMSGELDHNGMRFAGVFRIIAEGGTVSADNSNGPAKGMLSVDGADSAVIVLSLGTDYVNDFGADYRTGQDLGGVVRDVAKRVDDAGTDYSAMRERQIADYTELFDRAELDLGGVFPDDTTTDELLAEYRKGDRSPYLEALYFQYGRYLLISSSREGSLPANLQGVWNDRDYPDWASDYHTNINLQMNYWPAFVTNIAETATPLVDFVEGLREPGRISLAKTYGIADTGNEDGFIFFCSTSPLGFTGNINSTASFTPTATAFIAQNLYDQFAFTQDLDSLRDDIYPILRESSKTYLQTLQPGRAPDGSDHDKLFVAPSWSSEHGPWTVGTAFDQQLVAMLFTNTVKAAQSLGVDDGEDAELVARIQDAIPRLDAVEVAAGGQIREWQQEVQYNRTANGTKIGDDLHRHISQLVGLYPGDLITPERPELIAAAKVSLNKRGDAATGWSMGHKLNLWARTGDGDHAYKLLTNLLSNGTYNNLFDYHPPFQIDGNFGGTSGIAEMLLQSHTGTVDVLPALPSAWETGSFTGFKARGDVEVDARWEGGEVRSLAVTPGKAGPLTVASELFESDLVSLVDGKGKSIDFTREGDTVTFEAKAGERYEATNAVTIELVAPAKAAAGDTIEVLVSVSSAQNAAIPGASVELAVPETSAEGVDDWAVEPAKVELRPILRHKPITTAFTVHVGAGNDDRRSPITATVRTREGMATATTVVDVRPPAPCVVPPAKGTLFGWNLGAEPPEDTSGNGILPALVGSPPTAAEGPTGSAQTLGSAGYVQMAQDQVLGYLTEATFAAELKVNTASSYRRIFDSQPVNGNADGILIDLTPANKVRVITSNALTITDATVPFGKWVDVVVAISEDGTIRVFLDGVLASSNVIVGYDAIYGCNSRKLHVGANRNGGERLSGMVDRVAAFSGALSAEESAEWQSIAARRAEVVVD